MMPTVFCTAGLVLLFITVAFHLRAVAASDASWFAEVMNATDADLTARGVSRLRRDCARMRGIMEEIDRCDGVSVSHVTRPLASEQLDRLHLAMTEAARARFASMQQSSPKAGG